MDTGNAPRKGIFDDFRAFFSLDSAEDILKLREEVNGLTVKSASHEVDIQKNGDAVRKMEKQRNMDEQNWKAQMDAVHDVLDTKVNEKPFEDLKHCAASLTRGVVKFAQVVGVFPGPKFDDAEGRGFRYRYGTHASC